MKADILEVEDDPYVWPRDVNDFLFVCLSLSRNSSVLRHSDVALFVAIESLSSSFSSSSSSFFLSFFFFLFFFFFFFLFFFFSFSFSSFFLSFSFSFLSLFFLFFSFFLSFFFLFFSFFLSFFLSFFFFFLLSFFLPELTSGIDKFIYLTKKQLTLPVVLAVGRCYNRWYRLLLSSFSFLSFCTCLILLPHFSHKLFT